MAEERIGITKFKDKETPDFELCAYKLMTRQEAIKRIENAIYVEHNSETAAEAALNALLGE